MKKKRFIIILVILVALAGAIGGVIVYLNQNAYPAPLPEEQSMSGALADGMNDNETIMAGSVQAVSSQRDDGIIV